MTGDVETCIVIGGSGDVGLAVSHALGKAGYLCILTRSGKRDGRVREAALPANAEWAVVDVTDPTAVQDLIERIARTADNRFHLVYCAGVLHDRPIAMLRPEEWRAVLSVNLDGAFYALRSAFRPISIGGVGRIVLISSVSARRGFPGQAAYSASKGGLEALCRVAAVELGRFGITCNVVAPGAIETGMVRGVKPPVVRDIIHRTPTRRLGNAADIAAAVLFLLSERAGHISGQTLTLDGGLTIA